MRTQFLLALGFVFFAFSAQAETDIVKIVGLIPSGEEVYTTRQISVKFNKPIAKIGEKPSADLGVQITPAVNCDWNWAGTSNLVCNIKSGDELKKATQYTVQISKDAFLKNGKVLKDDYTHVFETERPRASYASFDEWRAPTFPKITANFTQAVEKKSVEKSFVFQAKSGDTKVKVTKVNENASDTYNTRWVIEPVKLLSAGEKVELWTTPGLVSKEGALPSRKRKALRRMKTFGAFEFLGLECRDKEREKVKISARTTSVKTCTPNDRVYLKFSSPVSFRQLKEKMDITPKLSNDMKKNDPWISYTDKEQRGRPDSAPYSVALPTLKANQTYTISTHQVAETPLSFWSLKGLKHSFAAFIDWITFWSDDAVQEDGVEISEDFIKDAIQDEFGRDLQEGFTIKFKTGHKKPDFDLKYRTAVIEKGIENDVPIFLTNLDKLMVDYKKTTANIFGESGTTAPEFDKTIRDISHVTTMGVQKLLGGESGILQGSVGSYPDLSRSSNSYTQEFTYQVTPFAVHAKIGFFNSYIWVTDLATGQPVKDAKVTVYVEDLKDIDGKGETREVAVTDKDGLAEIKGHLGGAYNTPYQRGKDLEPMIKVEKGKDLAFLPLEYDFKLNLYRIVDNMYSQKRSQYDYIKSWGFTSQGVYRAGEEMSFKIFVRGQDNEKFIAPPTAKYGLEIFDPTDKLVKEYKNITLSEFGSYHNKIKLSKNASVGWYTFKLTYNYDQASTSQSSFRKVFEKLFKPKKGSYHKGTTLYPLRVLVSDFNATEFKLSTEVNGKVFKQGDLVKMKSFAALHAGGAYTNADMRTTAILNTASLRTTHPLTRDFDFGISQSHAREELFQNIGKTDNNGAREESFKIPENKVLYGNLFIETAVQDDRGKYSTTSKTVKYRGVDRFVGLKVKSHVLSVGKKGEIKYLVVDPDGKPVKDTKVNLKIEREKTKIAKVKGAGNAYLTEYTKTWEGIDTCAGTPKDTEAKICAFTPQYPGRYKIIAVAKDKNGRSSEKEMSFFVEGPGYVVWDAREDNSLTLIPVDKDYKVGKTAKFLVQNPYPGAEALITVERYGILDKWTQTLKGSAPVIEIPIKKDYIPGVYVSVTVMSPRVAKPVDRGVDLGKPSFKIGYAEIPVVDETKKIKFNIKTDRAVYKPGEKVTLSISPETLKAQAGEDIEAAVIVLDEGILSLIQGGKKYFDPYSGFYALESLDVENYNLLLKLVGRQNIEKKGANAGGDGGSSISVRSNFKNVAYFNSSVKFESKSKRSVKKRMAKSKSTDMLMESAVADTESAVEEKENDGLSPRDDFQNTAVEKHLTLGKPYAEAKISFKAPDNLTGWKVFVIGVSKTDKMGMGDARFEVNKPLEIRPIMPNQVVEGDVFKAGFSVMNRTSKKQEVALSISATGTLAKDATRSQKKTVDVKPYERKIVYLETKVGTVPAVRNLNHGTINFKATAKGEGDLQDGVVHAVKVNKYSALDVFSNYGTTTEDSVTEELKFPKKIRGDMGDVTVDLSPTVIGGLTNAFEYIQDYPYTCWEQKLTKGIMAAHYQKLKKYLDKDFEWKNADKLLKEVLAEATNFQASNGGMAYFKPENKYVSPYLSAYTALGFNWLEDTGHKVPKTVRNNLDKYLQNALKRDIFPSYFNDSLSTDIRAVILSALSERGKADLSDVKRLEDKMDTMGVFTLSHYLTAAINTKADTALKEKILNKLLSASVTASGKFSFNENENILSKRILGSSLRSNCSALSAIVKAKKAGVDEDLISDIPFKIVRFITQSRTKAGHFENTQENTFCVNALLDYSKTYEAEKPDMKIKVVMDDTETLGETAFKKFTDPSKAFKHLINKDDIGRDAQIKISKEGDGRLYYMTRMTTASLDRDKGAVNAGIDVKKEYSVERNGQWVLLKKKAKIKRGELVRVDIYASVPTARNFVVIDDPVPGGLEPVNRDLANSSTIDSDKAEYAYAGGSFFFKYDDWISFDYSRWSFYHKELKHDSVRFYSDYLPAGNYHVAYTAQAIAEGEFVRMPVSASEMYDADIYGKGVTSTLTVESKE
ncbi:MAG: alpha-2-macroglobulin family protein [Alphaproteobacteria bacterium]